MQTPMAMAMLKSLIGEDQLDAMKRLTEELMKSMITIRDMKVQLDRMEAGLVKLRTDLDG